MISDTISDTTSSFSIPVSPELKLSIETSMLHARAELGFCSLRQSCSIQNKAGERGWRGNTMSPL